VEKRDATLDGNSTKPMESGLVALVIIDMYADKNVKKLITFIVDEL